MSLHALIYASRRVADMDADSLLRLGRMAWSINEANDITGMLIHSQGHFLQVLEGDPGLVADTYRRIAADPRHANLRVLSDGPAGRRWFPDWSMGFQDTPVVDIPVLDDPVRALALLRSYHTKITEGAR